MDSYNTDDNYNNDDFSPEGHGSHELDILSPDDIHSTRIQIEDSTRHDIASSTNSLGINKVDALTESRAYQSQNQEIPEVSDTGGFHNQLNKIMNPNGQESASSALESEISYNESLSEVKGHTLDSNNNVHNTAFKNTQNSQVPFGCTGCATKCLHTCSGACFTSCSGSCDGSSSGR